MSTGWMVRRIGTETWYEISHPTIPVVITLDLDNRADMEEWGENMNALYAMPGDIAERVATLLNREPR